MKIDLIVEKIANVEVKGVREVNSMSVQTDQLHLDKLMKSYHDSVNFQSVPNKLLNNNNINPIVNHNLNNELSLSDDEDQANNINKQNMLSNNVFSYDTFKTRNVNEADGIEVNNEIEEKTEIMDSKIENQPENNNKRRPSNNNLSLTDIQTNKEIDLNKSDLNKSNISVASGADTFRNQNV